MGQTRKRVSASDCRPLAQALITVRERGIVAEAWIERALDAALSSHGWDGGGRPYRRDLARRIARLVYSKAPKETLAERLARMKQEPRVVSRVLAFFRDQGLDETGLPLDHPDVGREQVMAAMLGRFIAGHAAAYHETDLAQQGAYILLQKAGDTQVNRSLLLIDALNSRNVIWAVHLYRSPNYPDAKLSMRTGVFLPQDGNIALMSSSRWISAEPLIRKHVGSGDADSVLRGISSGSAGDDSEAREFAILTLKPQGSATMRIKEVAREFGFVKLEGLADAEVFATLGLTNRNLLSAREAAAIPGYSVSHAQAYAEAQEALARFALIAGASRAQEAITAPAGTGEPELAAGPAGIPGVQAQAIASDLSADNPPPENQFGDGEDAPPAQIS